MRFNFLQFLSFLFLAFIVWLSFVTLKPQVQQETEDLQSFSLQKAKQHVQEIAQEPHYVGSDNHSKVRNYILNALYDLDISAHTQQSVSLNKNGVVTIPENIIAHIPGTDQTEKSLLVLTHYDSEPHSSYGASDDASGIAVILELLRTLKEKNQKFENDIVILFSDAEEIGLNGAQLFVEKHPLAKDIGLVLNFEARGSGGPSNMILETNHGNTQLIKDFADADLGHPLTNSLMYSVYKLLPNDTDATVFREEADIPSFFFAFIDDHFDYHTALDLPENLDEASLLHQFEYLKASVEKFGDSDLSSLLTEADSAYFSFSYLGVLHFGFVWTWPLFIVACLFFVFLFYRAHQKGELRWRSFFKLALIWLLVLLGIPFLLYGLWQLILVIYPGYSEILQGFTYNGHDYILAFSFLSLAILFFVFYKKRSMNSVFEVALPGVFFWLVLMAVLNVYLRGATFFMIPVLFSELILLLCLFKFRLNAVIKNLLAVPILVILCQYVLFFPVGLGLEMLLLSGLFIVLIFILIYPVLHAYEFQKLLSVVFLMGAIFYCLNAHFTSNFTEKQPKPNSLVYHADLDLNKAYWHTYDALLDEWTLPYFEKAAKKTAETPLIQSKYNSRFTQTANAEFVPFAAAEIVTDKVVNGDFTTYEITIQPSEETERLIIYKDQMLDFKDFSVNGETVKPADSSSYLPFYNRNQSTLIDYYVVQNEALHLKFSLDRGVQPEFSIRQINYNLLKDVDLNVQPRLKWMMPKPFVINDAIMTTQKMTQQ